MEMVMNALLAIEAQLDAHQSSEALSESVAPSRMETIRSQNSAAERQPQSQPAFAIPAYV